MTATARIGGVTAAMVVLAAVLAARTGFGHPAFWAVPALAVAVAATELLVVHVAFRRQRWTFSLTEGVVGAAVLLAGGAWTVPAVAVGTLVAQLVRRQPRLKAGFNVALFAVAAAVASAVAAALGGGVAAAAAGLACFWAVNTALVAVPICVLTGQRVVRLWWDSVSFSTVQEAGTASIGLLAGWLAVHAPAGLLGLVVPVVLLWISYDEHSSRAAEARLFAELASGHERASGRSVDVSAEVVLTAAARLFGGADVELVLVGADGPVRYVGDEYGVSRRRVEPAAFDEPWVMAALGAGRVRVGADGQRRPWCTAVLTSAGEPLAVLRARRPADGQPFGRHEAALARVLVSQAESWLSVAELTASRDEARELAEAASRSARHLGDLGAVTAPALMLLRDSASRLERAARTLDAPEQVGGIVDELHAVERAVASLLGAVALAAETDLVDPAVTGGSAPVVLPPESEPAWTTTGVLAPAALRPPTLRSTG